MAADYIQKAELFQRRLKDAMKKERVTQEALAAKAGIAQSAISAYLNGQRFPKVKTLRDIAAVLSVEPSYLMGMDRETETERIIGKYYSLDGFNRAKVEGYMDSLISIAQEGR